MNLTFDQQGKEKMSVLQLKDVSLNYHSHKGETQALKNITFDVKDNEFISIVGPSGCGKTTILSLIAGILKPSSGEIIQDEKTENYIGYMFQRDHLFEWRTIWQNVILGLEIQKKKNTQNFEYVTKLLKNYGLYEFKDKFPRELSGGMRQRVALIRTLALNPQILLLDEPFSALDYQTRLNVCDDVSSIIKSEKKTAILVTHDISEAISMSDRIIILTPRPAEIKKILTLNLQNYGTPFQRRKCPEFSELFNSIWKDLEN